MKPRAKALTWLLVVFVIGTALGSTLTLSLLRPGGVPARNEELQKEEASKRFTERLIGELGLNQDQEVQVREILARGEERLKAMYKERQRGHREIRRNTIEEIRALLEPAQQSKLDEFLKELSRRRRARKPESATPPGQ